MSVRVNLLPEATKQRGQAKQQRVVAAAVAGLLVLALGGIWLWANNQVRQAEDQLAAEQSVTAGLRADQAELVAFRDLATRSDTAQETLRAALAGEVSLAGLLQDLAAVLPDDAQFDTLSITLVPATEAGESDERAGSLTISGRTLTAHAPGVERLLLSLDKIATLEDLFMTSSSLDQETAEEGVAAFTVDGQVSLNARTGRYAEGLPEALR